MTRPPYGTLPRMGVSYMVRGRTRQECEQALAELCQRLGAHPTLNPTDRCGHGWIARAVAAPRRDLPAAR